MGVTAFVRDSLRVEMLPELGGRIHRLAVDDFDLLRTPDTIATAIADPFFWSGFVMAPWANRVPDGRLATPAGEVELTPNFADGSAIHGEVYACPWDVTGDNSMAVRGGGGAGFPWRYRVTSILEATSARVHYRLGLRNEDDEPMPAGLGWHPWFNADDGTLEVGLRARRAYDQHNYLAVGEPVDVESDRSLADGRSLPWGWHEVYTDLVEPRVELRWPRRGITVELEFTGEADHVVVYASREHGAVAVEPQTHAPDGHRRAVAGQRGGVSTLPPGEELGVDYRLLIHRTSRSDT